MERARLFVPKRTKPLCTKHYLYQMRHSASNYSLPRQRPGTPDPVAKMTSSHRAEVHKDFHKPSDLFCPRPHYVVHVPPGMYSFIPRRLKLLNFTGQPKPK